MKSAKFHKITVTLSDFQYTKLLAQVEASNKRGDQTTISHEVRELLAKGWGDE